MRSMLRNATKMIFAISGVAGIAAIGFVAISGLDYDHESSMLEAISGAGPTVAESLIGTGMATQAYLSVGR
jgi:hypothetical protein